MFNTSSSAFQKAYQFIKIPLAFYRIQDGRLEPILVSDGFCEMMHMDSSQLLHHLKQSTFTNIHPDDAGKLQNAVIDFMTSEGVYDVIYRSELDKKGEYHYIHSYGTWQQLENGEKIMCVIYLDLSKCIDESEKILAAYKMSLQDHFFTDPLTSLPNFNYFNQFAEGCASAIRAAGHQPFLMYSDVIGMQYYNEQYGYASGNDLLCLISDVLKEEFSGALVVRSSDDHFIVLGEFLNAKDVSCKIAKVNTLIRQQTSGKTIGMKTGVCIFDEQMDTLTALDHAKSAAKWIENDINRMYCYYTKSQQQHFQKQQYVLENLDKAIKNKWIKIYYQGISRVKTGKVSAFEALARWIDPQFGTLSPADFIPVLKKFHLMHKLDLYVAEQVCRDTEIWDSYGFVAIPVTVNFSAQDFDYVNVPVALSSLYEKIIGKSDEKQKRVIVEITEQDVAQATENFHKQIKQLREMGFHVWLDDFGSGYSSLSNFGLISVDLIKFDMDLLKNLDGHKGINRLIIQAMTEIARDVGVHTLSEGMETELQKSFLEKAGCELAQGYLFHKPEPLDVIIERIKQQNCPKECETPDERFSRGEEWLRQDDGKIFKEVEMS